jgi:hypothetical protein
MSYISADELLAETPDTNNSWESRLDYELAEQLLGHSLTVSEWEELVDELNDAVFEIVMSFKRD